MTFGEQGTSKSRYLCAYNYADVNVINLYQTMEVGSQYARANRRTRMIQLI